MRTKPRYFISYFEVSEEKGSKERSFGPFAALHLRALSLSLSVSLSNPIPLFLSPQMAAALQRKPKVREENRRDSHARGGSGGRDGWMNAAFARLLF